VPEPCGGGGAAAPDVAAAAAAARAAAAAAKRAAERASAAKNEHDSGIRLVLGSLDEPTKQRVCTHMGIDYKSSKNDNPRSRPRNTPEAIANQIRMLVRSKIEWLEENPDYWKQDATNRDKSRTDLVKAYEDNGKVKRGYNPGERKIIHEEVASHGKGKYKSLKVGNKEPRMAVVISLVSLDQPQGPDQVSAANDAMAQDEDSEEIVGAGGTAVKRKGNDDVPMVENEPKNKIKRRELDSALDRLLALFSCWSLCRCGGSLEATEPSPFSPRIDDDKAPGATADTATKVLSTAPAVTLSTVTTVPTTEEAVSLLPPPSSRSAVPAAAQLLDSDNLASN